MGETVRHQKKKPSARREDVGQAGGGGGGLGSKLGSVTNARSPVHDAMVTRACVALKGALRVHRIGYEIHVPAVAASGTWL